MIYFRITTGMVVMVYHLWINKGEMMRDYETERWWWRWCKDGEMVVVG